MNLNKLLCKYLDRGDKGYVTMGNLITAASVLVGPLLIIMMYAQGAIVAYEHYTSVRVVGDTWSRFEGVSMAVFFVATFFAISVVLATTIKLILIGIVEIWGIEIVKCERKDDKEES